MSANQVDKWLSMIGDQRYNPAGIQQSIVAGLREITNGKISLVDASNPVVFQLECAAMLASAAITEGSILTRRQYPALAQTPEELYQHMSDKDFVDRFAVPSTAKFMLLFNKEELLNKMVEDADDSNIRKLVITRDSFVEVAETMVFGLQYPIIMRQMSHGGLQIVYDVSQVSPLQTLSTNRIDYQSVKDDAGKEYIYFEIQLQQFSIQSSSNDVNKSQPFVKTFTVIDQYYYARVWINNGDTTFTEMKTSHTDDVYDPMTPTAILKLTGDQLTVKIPQVYVNTNLVNKTVRVDVYQTKGPLDVNLENYTGQHVMKFRALNPAEQDAYWAPLPNLQELQVHSPYRTQGGRNAMTFSELRQRVITNSVGDPSVPITPAQIQAVLERNGYKVVKNIDQITNRTFLATAPMPDPVDTDLITAAAAGISIWPARITDVVGLNTVTDNGTLVTVRPDTLYRWDNGVIRAVPSAEVTFLKALPPDQLAIAVNNDSFLYSPFTYVLDSSNDEFNMRPYYLDAPSITGRTFVGENDSTGLQVSTDTIAVTRTLTGYRLTLQVKSSEAYKALPDSQVKIQLAFRPRNEATLAYMLGTQIGLSEDTDERIFTFDLSMNDAINSSHELAMTEFQMFTTAPRVTNIALDVEFDILHSTDAPIGVDWQSVDFDPMLGYFQLPSNSRAVTREKVRVVFGNYLEHLWARSRTVVSGNVYEKWATDVPATYSKNVYQVDPATGLEFRVVSGNLVWTKLHSVGDAILNENSQPVYKHRAGDVKLDAYGNPTIIQTRDLQRQMNIFFVEGSYYFATNKVTTDYRQSLVGTIVSRLTNEMEEISESLLEQTYLYYYPTTTTGSVEVMYGAGLVSTIQAGQSFEVTLYAGKSVYENLQLRDTIQRKTIKTISDQLGFREVAHSDIVDAMRAQYGNDIKGFELSKLGGAANLGIVKMVDDSKRLALRKRLVSRNDATLALEEDVTFTWVLHQRDDLSL